MMTKEDGRPVRVAIVHEWLTVYAGAERVLEQMLMCYPEADLFAILDFVPENERAFMMGKKPVTTFIQKLPFAQKKYRGYLPLMPLAIEQLDLSGYDIVLTSAHAVGKGVLTGPDQLHVSYVHSPIRYAWDLQHQYLKESGLTSGAKAWLARWLLHKIRLWDVRTAAGVDVFLANSHFIGRRIKKVYGRDSDVVYPPVDTAAFSLREDKEDFYLVASRMVPYKKIDLIVEAFSATPHRRLVVIGTGPDFEKIKAKAGPNVTLLGYQSFQSLKDYMQRAKAFVFAAEEDFGIAVVEAQACGTPVIAYGKGGARESIRGLDAETPTGVFFWEQTAASIHTALDQFEALPTPISPLACRDNAIFFGPERFRAELKQEVSAAWAKFQQLCQTPLKLKRVSLSKES
ncbi:Glycosyltransferase involved in cell wall bisynthesis [Duganella sp. CF402]|nr:glycosyltransferase involved in cell wall biosynthesis [Duganella sp. BK701]SEN24209.1 Glycosyltransferase involved in cell wall bisynthesis [Duganella sp. CF402]